MISRQTFFCLAIALGARAGAQISTDAEVAGWKPFQDSYLKYRSGGSAYVMAVHLLWGANRDGALKIDVAPHIGTGWGRARRVYSGVTSWNWCVLASMGGAGEPFLLVNGYPEISPPKTTFFKLRGVRLVPFPEGARLAALKRLESACFAYAARRRQRLYLLEAHWAKGAWRLREARTASTRRASPKPTVSPDHR